MNPRVKHVTAHDDYSLTLVFSNGEHRLFDMKPYLGHGIFAELRDRSYFKRVTVGHGTVCWPHEQDVCPDTLYEESIAAASPASV